MGSLGCKVQTLRMIQPWGIRNGKTGSSGAKGWAADFFLRPPTFTASNFEDLQSKDPIFTILKNLHFSKGLEFNDVNIVCRLKLSKLEVSRKSLPPGPSSTQTSRPRFEFAQESNHSQSLIASSFAAL